MLYKQKNTQEIDTRLSGVSKENKKKQAINGKKRKKDKVGL